MSLAQRAMQHPRLSPIYERAWRPALFFTAMGFDLAHYRREKQHAISAMRLASGSTVVDIACGPGNFTATLASAVGPSGRAIGVDLSPPMLARALADNAGTGASYVLGSGHHLPFAEGSLDAALCYGALYLIPDPFRVVDEMVRVVRPGGRLAIMTSLGSSLPALHRVQEVVAAPSGLALFDREAITGRLRSLGCTEVSYEAHGLLQYVAATRT